MVEVGTNESLVVLAECEIAPNRSPEACSVARHHGYVLPVFREYVDREFNVLLSTDIIVLSLQVVDQFYLIDISSEVTDFLSLGIDGESRFDIL